MTPRRDLRTGGNRQGPAEAKRKEAKPNPEPVADKSLGLKPAIKVTEKPSSFLGSQPQFYAEAQPAREQQGPRFEKRKITCPDCFVSWEEEFQLSAQTEAARALIEAVEVWDWPEVRRQAEKLRTALEGK